MASEPVAVGGLSSHLVPPRSGVTGDLGLRPLVSHSLLSLEVFRVVSEASHLGIGNYREMLMPHVLREAFFGMAGITALPPGRSYIKPQFLVQFRRFSRRC